MGWSSISLNDGNSVPAIAFGSATRRSPGAESKSVEHLASALETGFLHLDTAQQYGNESDVGEAVKRSSLSREEIFITTKWSDGSMPARQACEESLKALGVTYLNLYVIHHTWTCKGDIKGAWRQMEEIKEAGLARSIGLSAFGFSEVTEILQSCQYKPAVNMIMLHPNVLHETQPLLDLMTEHNVVPGGYSSLKPLWDQETESEVKVIVSKIGQRLGCKPQDILLQWCAAKGAIIYTSSTSLDRIKGYIGAGDVEITQDDVQRLDDAGLHGSNT